MPGLLILGVGGNSIGGECVQLLFHETAAEGILDFEVLFVFRDEADDFLMAQSLYQFVERFKRDQQIQRCSGL